MHPIIGFELARSRIAQSHRQPAAAASHVPGPADHAQVRRLEKTSGWTRRERLRILWYRLRLTVQELNDATGRMAELRTRLPTLVTRRFRRCS